MFNIRVGAANISKYNDLCMVLSWIMLVRATYGVPQLDGNVWRHVAR